MTHQGNPQSITEILKRANKEIIQIVQQKEDASDFQRDKLCRELKMNEDLLIEFEKSFMSKDLSLVKTKVALAKLQLQVLDQTKRITQFQQDSAIQGRKVDELEKKMRARKKEIIRLRKKPFKDVKDEIDEQEVEDEARGPQGPEEAHLGMG